MNLSQGRENAEVTHCFNLFDIFLAIREPPFHIPPLPTGFGHTGNPFGGTRIFLSESQFLLSETGNK